MRTPRISLAMSLLALVVFKTQAQVQTIPKVRAILVRKDALPKVRGKYEVGHLPATEQCFALTKEELTAAPDTGANPAELMICEWGQAPSGKCIARWTYGSNSHGLASPNGSVVAWLTMGFPPGGERWHRFHFLRDLKIIRKFEFNEYDAYLVGVSNNGEAVLRMPKDRRVALRVSVQEGIRTISFKDTFLNWDFESQQAICANGRKIVVHRGKRRTELAELPFVPDRASPFGEGKILVGSRPIGREGPSWRVLLDSQGKILGEHVFGYWEFLPEKQAVKGMCCLFSYDPNGPRKPSEQIVVFRESGRWAPQNSLELLSRSNLFREHTLPGSDSFHRYECLDSRGNVYSLKQKKVPGGEKRERSVQTVVKFRPHADPLELVCGESVAKFLKKDEVWVYSMTVSRDGNWLGIVISPPGHFEAEEPWLLLQYRIEWPEHIH